MKPVKQKRGGMTHVLVTRPAEESVQLAGMLSGHGLQPIVMPFYAFSARSLPDRAGRALSASAQRKLLVFTSPRAVQFGLSHLPADTGGKLELAAVGSATRARLESHGYTVQIQSSEGFTSEDLLRVPELSADPGRAIIFCAPDGRKALAEGLRRLGWEVVDALVYERRPLSPEPAQQEQLGRADRLLSVWTSISALNLAKAHLPGPLWAKILAAPALVISGRIRQHLLGMGAGAVELADGPGNADLLQSILRMCVEKTTSDTRNDG